MNYKEIEMEWMKEILRDKEEEIKKLKSDLSLVIKERDDNIKQNKKLKEDNRFLTKISKEYMKKENIIEVAEFTELYKDELEEENKKLQERIRFLEQCLDNKEKVNKSLREENKRLSDFLECES